MLSTGFTCLMMIDAGYSNESSWLDKAEQEILSGIRDDPTFTRGHSALAAVLLFRARKEAARGPVVQAPRGLARKLEEDNSSRIARFFPSRMNLADLARQEGNWAAARRQLSEVIEYDPQNGHVLQRLARLYMDSGDLPLARQTLDRLLPIDRRSFGTQSLEALLLALEGNRDQATKLLDEDLLNYLELNPLVTLTAAEVYSVMSNTQQALLWLERAVRHGDERGAWFARDPALAGLRANARFQQIIQSLTRLNAHEGERH